MPISIEKKQVSAQVTKEDSKIKSIVTDHPLVTVVQTVGPCANVGFKGGVTKNMGDYSSVRVDVSLFMPVELEPEGEFDKRLEERFTFIKEWVDGKLNEIMK